MNEQIEQNARQIGQFISQERARKKITMTTMAGLVGKCTCQVFNTENKTIRTTLRNILVLLDYLGYELMVVPKQGTRDQ